MSGWHGLNSSNKATDVNGCLQRTPTKESGVRSLPTSARRQESSDSIFFLECLFRDLLSIVIAVALAGCATAPIQSPTATESPLAVATTAPTITATQTPIQPTAPSTSTPTKTATATRTQTRTPTTAPSIPAPSATASSSAAGDDFTPKVNAVWETAIGEDIMTGTCSGGPILPVYGLVQITPQGDTLIWLSQEPAPYTFFRTSPDTYYYSGPTSINDGSVTMILRFTGPTALVMQRVFTPNSDPACQHTHNYTGVFQWNVPQ